MDHVSEMFTKLRELRVKLEEMHCPKADELLKELAYTLSKDIPAKDVLLKIDSIEKELEAMRKKKVTS